MTAAAERILGVVALAAVASHCGGHVNGGAADGGPGDDAGCLGTAGVDGGRGVPAEHRAQPEACGPNGPASSLQTPCSSDADCQGGAGTSGPYCLGHACGNDLCWVDSDCKYGKVCVCSANNGTGLGRSNACVPATCHQDSDCGAGEYCSPSRGYCGAVEGYYCHSSKDTCVDPVADCQCGAPYPAPPLNACVYVPEVGHFACGTSTCSG